MWNVEKLIYGNEKIFNLSKEQGVILSYQLCLRRQLEKKVKWFGKYIQNSGKCPTCSATFFFKCLLYLMEIWIQLRAGLTSGHCMCACVCVCMRAYIPISVFVWKRERLSGCMCYFCWASHIERTNNLFQLRRAAAPVTAEGAVLHRITSSFEKPQDWLIVTWREPGSFRNN